MMRLSVLLLSVLVVAYARPAEPELYKFSWEDCGSDPNRPLRLYSLSVSPDPIKVPGKLQISFDMENKAQIANLDAKIKLEKKILFTYITITTQNIDDVCNKVSSGNPCPIPSGKLTLEKREFDLPELPEWVPGSLASGQYRVTTTLSEHGTGKELGCLKLQLQIDA